MEKKFAIGTPADFDRYATEEEATDKAKRYTSKYQREYIVMQAIATVTTPTPEAIVTKIT